MVLGLTLFALVSPVQNLPLSLDFEALMAHYPQLFVDFLQLFVLLLQLFVVLLQLLVLLED